MSDEVQRTRLVDVQCPTCGLPNAATDHFCTWCGASLRGAEPTPLEPEPVESDSDGPESVRPPSAPEPSTQTMAGGSKTRPISSPVDWKEACVTHKVSTDELATYPFEHEFVIGREVGDLQLPNDPFLSAKHLAIRRVGSRYVLEDLDSSNGTFIRLRAEVELRPGDEILIGSQVFRFLV